MSEMIGRHVIHQIALGYDSTNDKNVYNEVESQIIDRLENENGLYYLVRITDESYQYIETYNIKKIQLINSTDITDIK